MSADGERGGVRASNRERELVVQRLARAFAHGRLTPAEYDERVAAAYACTDRDELARLTDDLPGRLW
ncbi:MAG TPA: DUF1707 domain-containing protein [Actinomycetospora sp.]|uniref:DUF1707 SHOCT-like domain-containing protein n=1 Tax=Actinomycetospora sp. TaxID=1872135 RepID=UPI002F3E7624